MRSPVLMGILFLFLPFTSIASYEFVKNLGYGSQGIDVAQLQELLRSDSTLYPEGVASGFFGSLTRKAVIRFQKRHSIKPSFGFVGPLTRTTLRALANGSKQLHTQISAIQKRKEVGITIPSTAIFANGTTTSVEAGSPLVVILQRSEEKISSGNGGGVPVRNGSVLESQINIADMASWHSCTIEPFSRTIARARSSDYAISLTPSHREKRFRLLTGSLPDGVTGVFRSTEKDLHAVTLTLTVNEDASRGSFNAVVIYEEIQESGTPLRSFCQLNLVVE